jgi:hypothetical protein
VDFCSSNDKLIAKLNMTFMEDESREPFSLAFEEGNKVLKVPAANPDCLRDQQDLHALPVPQLLHAGLESLQIPAIKVRATLHPPKDLLASLYTADLRR